MAFRDIKRQMRRDLHTHMQVPALYVMGAAAPLPVNVRIHDHFADLGASQQPAFAAKAAEATPKIRFDRTQVVPQRGAIVSVAAGEAYRVGNVEPSDDEFQYAAVARLTTSEAVGLPVPE